MLLRLSMVSAMSLATLSTAFAEGSSFNPDISLILDGRFTAFDNESDYELPALCWVEKRPRGGGFPPWP